MDKQVEAAQADSISAVRVKVGDYEPSEFSEAPPVSHLDCFLPLLLWQPTYIF